MLNVISVQAAVILNYSCADETRYYDSFLFTYKRLEKCSCSDQIPKFFISFIADA